MSSIESSPGPNPKALLQQERVSPSFDTDKMYVWLNGNDEKEAARLKIFIQQIERDPVLAASSRDYDYTRPQQLEITALKINRMARYAEIDGLDIFNRKLYCLVSVFDTQLGTRLIVDVGLFLNAIRSNGTAEQLKFWSATKETPALKGIFGCFALTELAHGSDTASVETTATFDAKTDEFVINTPHIGATKWWIGGAAHSATHAVVYARLIVEGKDHGVKVFVTPLRDSNHDLMPGVTIGDIGAKMGRAGVDNGWIQFSSVRIPRAFMLQKFSKIDNEGNVRQSAPAQLALAALVSGRVVIVGDSFRAGARFITIALRYAVARKQFRVKANSTETQIIDYPLHQRRLFPYLAMIYAFSAGAVKLESSLSDILTRLDKAVSDNDQTSLAASVVEMKNMFTDSAALKSTCSWVISGLIDEARQACGGHGYSAYAGFGKGFDDWSVQCTWEGDNNVLAGSAGKSLIQALSKLIEGGQSVKGTLSFLNNFKEYVNDEIIISKENLGIDKIILGLQVLITRLAYSCHVLLSERRGDYETIGVQKVQLAKLKAHNYLLSEFNSRAESADSSIKNALRNLVHLYAFTLIESFSGLFVTFKILTPELFNYITYEKINELCLLVRPDIITLTDSFNYPDSFINSALGSYDGNIYENYFRIVKDQNPPSITKAPYSSVFEASLNRTSLDERQRFEFSAKVLNTLSK